MRVLQSARIEVTHDSGRSAPLNITLVRVSGIVGNPYAVWRSPQLPDIPMRTHNATHGLSGNTPATSGVRHGRCEPPASIRARGNLARRTRALGANRRGGTADLRGDDESDPVAPLGPWLLVSPDRRHRPGLHRRRGVVPSRLPSLRESAVTRDVRVALPNGAVLHHCDA